MSHLKTKLVSWRPMSQQLGICHKRGQNQAINRFSIICVYNKKQAGAIIE